MAAGRVGTLVRGALEERVGPSRFLQPAWQAIAREIGLESGAFLDLAAGDGWVCLYVAAGKPELDAVGLERDPVRRARAERHKGHRLNCTFKDGAPDELAWPADTFQAVLALQAASGWADPAAVVAEVHRVLAPGGRFLVYEPIPGADVPADFVARTGPWPPDALVKRWIGRHAVDDAAWSALKDVVRRSPFGGGEEGRHGFYRRLVLRKARR